MIGDSLGCEASNLTKKLVKIEEELGCWCLDVLKVVHGWLIALTSYKLRGTTDLTTSLSETAWLSLFFVGLGL